MKDVETKHRFLELRAQGKSLRTVADDLAAFMEAYLALQNGISNAQLRTAVREKSLFYRHKTIAGIDFGKVYKGFH